MNKITIIGAGNIGVIIAEKIVNNDKIDEIILLDNNKGIAEAKATDIKKSISSDINITIKGVTNSYSETKDSHIIIIAPSASYKESSSQEETIKNNKKYIKNIVSKTIKYSPDAIYIIAINPVDTMVQAVINELGVAYADHIMGIGNLLDTYNFKENILNKYNEKYPDEPISINDIKSAYVIGGHNNTMIILTNKVKIFRNPLNIIFTQEEIIDIIDKTQHCYITFINDINTNALEIIGQCVYEIVMKLFNNSSGLIVEFLPLSVYRTTYDLCIGSLVSINYNGIERTYIEENNDILIHEKFMESVEAVRAVNEAL